MIQAASLIKQHERFKLFPHKESAIFSFPNQNMRHSTNKTQLKTVFIGTNAQMGLLQTLVDVMNRLTIHSTHFMKFHGVNHPETIFSPQKCSAIITLMNNRNTKVHFAEEFKTSMLAYKALHAHGFQDESFKNIDQLANYHGRAIYSQYLTNIQENFAKKLKSYCTAMIVTRFQNQVPLGMNRFVYSIYI